MYWLNLKFLALSPLVAIGDKPTLWVFVTGSMAIFNFITNIIKKKGDLDMKIIKYYGWIVSGIYAWGR